MSVDGAGFAQARDEAYGRLVHDVWGNRAVRADLVRAPIPDDLVAWLKDAYGSRLQVIGNRALPWAQRLRVVEAMKPSARKSLDRLLIDGSLHAEAWASLLGLVPQDTAASAVHRLRKSDPAGFTRLVEWVWRHGDERARARLAGLLPLHAGPHPRQGSLSVMRAVSDPSPTVRAALARNPTWMSLRSQMRLPVYQAAYALLADPDPAVRLAARQRSLTRTLTPARSSEEVRADAALRETGPDGLFPDVWADPDPRVRATAIDGTGTRCSEAERWERLLADPSPEVRVRVAKFARTPTGVLCVLAADGEARVRAAAAKAPGLPVTQLTRLANDPAAVVRRAAAGRLLAVLAS